MPMLSSNACDFNRIKPRHIVMMQWGLLLHGWLSMHGLQHRLWPHKRHCLSWGNCTLG